MKRVLIIQSRREDTRAAEAEREVYHRAVGERAAPSFVYSTDEAVSWEKPERVLAGYDGVILGGSSDFDFDGGRCADDPACVNALAIMERLRLLIVHLIRQQVPTLGICFGHQLIGKVMGGEILNDAAQCKFGTFPVVLTEEGTRDLVLGSLPHSCMAQYGHKDSLISLPEGATLLASNACCRFSALRYGARCYTLQFHPELDQEDMRGKSQFFPAHFLRGKSLDEILQPSPEASLIIPLFIDHVVDVSVAAR